MIAGPRIVVEANDRLRSAGGARWTPWLARPKASDFPSSHCVHGGSGGGNASAGVDVKEEDASKLRLFRRSTIRDRDRERMGNPCFALQEIAELSLTEK